MELGHVQSDSFTELHLYFEMLFLPKMTSLFKFFSLRQAD